MNHKTKIIEIDGIEVPVDKKIALFIGCLNDFGFTTSLSCEDNNGQIWINFPNMEIVNNLMQTLQGNDSPLFEFFQTAEWTVCWDENGMISPYEDRFIGNGIIDYSVSLRFPKEEFETVEYLLYQVLCPEDIKKAEAETSA